MTEEMRKSFDKLREYGEATLAGMAEVLPVFDNLLKSAAPTAKKLIGHRQEVLDIKRKARVDYMANLIEAGAPPANAAEIIYREMELDAESDNRYLEIIQQFAPLIQNTATALLMKLVMSGEAPPAPGGPMPPIGAVFNFSRDTGEPEEE